VLSGCTLGDAIRMATCGPADLLGLTIGRIVQGTPADLMCFHWNDGDQSLQVEEVVKQGQTVPKAASV